MEQNAPAPPPDQESPAQPGVETDLPLSSSSGQLMIGGYQGPMSKKAAAAFKSGHSGFASGGQGSRISDRALLLGVLAVGCLLLLGLSGTLLWMRFHGDAPVATPQVPGSSVPAALGGTGATIATPGATTAPDR